ncbi:MAG: dipeptidase PepE [Flavobacteriales bacterium]|nr:dipeptidase PepE [Flavobacteriales bacterium]
MRTDLHALLLSNSTIPGEGFLAWAVEDLKRFLGDRKKIAFVPYAAVGFSYDEYFSKVDQVLGALGHTCLAVHADKEPVRLLGEADVIAVGGGNTFQLLKLLYKFDLVRAIRKQVRGGASYVGWSAGSNVACPTIMTTNDMPVAEPPSFMGLQLVGYQINPHYTEATIPGHGGESRDQRITEFLELHPDIPVAGLYEGSLLLHEQGRISLRGKGLKRFAHGTPPVTILGGQELGPDLSPTTASQG